MHTAIVSDDAKALGGFCGLLAASNAIITVLAAHMSRSQQPENQLVPAARCFSGSCCLVICLFIKLLDPSKNIYKLSFVCISIIFKLSF